MRLYFDLSMGRLMQVAGYTSALGSMELKRGDAARLEISFTRGAAAAALTGTPSEMVFVVKKSLAAEGAVLMLAHDWTLDAVTGIWSAALSSDTVALTNQLGNSNFIDLLGEFSFTDDAGGPCTSQTIKVRVTNDLWKGTEDTPLALPTPATWLAEVLPGALAAFGFAPGNWATETAGESPVDGLQTVEVTVTPKVGFDFGTSQVLNLHIGLSSHNVTYTGVTGDTALTTAAAMAAMALQSGITDYWAIGPQVGNTFTLVQLAEGLMGFASIGGLGDAFGTIGGVITDGAYRRAGYLGQELIAAMENVYKCVRLQTALDPAQWKKLS